MDEKKLLKEATLTLKNIQSAQETLDVYMDRLEKIIAKLEHDIYSEEHLTMQDVTMINQKISIDETKKKVK